MHGDQLVTLQGEINQTPKQAQLHQFKRLQTTRDISSLHSTNANTKKIV